MIVVTSQLQRDISQHGIEDVLKLAGDTSGNLKRLDRSPREADSVTNLASGLKMELDKIPTSEHGQCAVEVNTDVARTWMTVLATHARRVARITQAAAKLPELGDLRNKTQTEQAADSLVEQLQGQLNLPIQTLDSILADQDAREKEEDREFAYGTDLAPHRGVGTHAPGTTFVDGEPVLADSRGKRGPKPGGKKWNRQHTKAKKGEPQLDGATATGVVTDEVSSTPSEVWDEGPPAVKAADVEPLVP